MHVQANHLSGLARNRLGRESNYKWTTRTTLCCSTVHLATRPSNCARWLLFKLLLLKTPHLHALLLAEAQAPLSSMFEMAEEASGAVFTCFPLIVCKDTRPAGPLIMQDGAH